MHFRFSALALAAGLTSAGLAAALSAEDIPSDTPISSLLSSAQGHLTRGETSDALVYYDAAVARDPKDYLTFFKRATTYLSLGRTSAATDDFNTVLSLEPGFEGAHVQLGKIRARAADWDGARAEYRLAGRAVDAGDLASLEEARGAAVLAEAAAASGNWEECVNQAGVAVAVATRAAHLRELRARCRFEKGEMEEGMADLRHVLQMRPGDITPHLLISAVSFYALDDAEKGLAQVRKCLHSDPESKPCKKLLRGEKAVEKTLGKIAKAFEKKQPMTGTKLLVPSADEEGLIKEVKDEVQALREEGTIPAAAGNALVARLVGLACQGYYEMNNKKAESYCQEALELDEKALFALLHKADAQLGADEFDAAIATLRKAGDAHPSRQDIVNPLLQKAQVALKRSKTKDYYKVLGVAHDADERQIKSAYRKLSKVHHPDKAAKQGISKEVAEKKMATINESYEVLSDPELRARFDRGDDPNSHEQQRQNPFHGSPFGHGGGHGQQQFHFQFGGGGGGSGGFPFGR